MSIVTNLKRLRSKTKYSQQDIADMLNVDRLTYINWENETTDVKASYIPKLADVFGVNIQELFDKEQQQVQINNFENTESSKATGQQGIIINLSDSESTQKLLDQLQELIKALKK